MPKKNKSLAIRDNKLTGYLMQVRAELAKVIWPTRSQTIKLTFIVIGVSIFMALYIGLLDVSFTNLINKLIAL